MGMDFSTGLKEGVPIYASERGWLVRLEIDRDDIYGYTVVLEHENGYRTLYAHLSGFAKKLEVIVESLKEEFGDVRMLWSSQKKRSGLKREKLWDTPVLPGKRPYHTHTLR